MLKLSLTTMVAAAVVYVAGPIAPPDTVRGAWEGDFCSLAEHRPLGRASLELRPEGTRRRTEWHAGVPLRELEGLRLPLADAASERLRFELRREAGRFVFEGRMQDEGAAGTFTFEPAPAFGDEMGRLGYADLDGETLARLALHDVRTENVRALRGLGYADLSLKQLIRFHVHDVTPDFIRELAENGYRGVGAEDLVRLRIHGVDSEFIREMNAHLEDPGR